MMYFSAFTLICLFALYIHGIHSQLPEFLKSLKPVNNIQIAALTGRWYQMYTSLIPQNTIELDGKCIIADVRGPISEDRLTLSIDASMNVGSPSASPRQASGIVASNKPGVFTAQSNGQSIDILIIAVGETTSDNPQYPWVVLSDAMRINLFIVTRDINEFDAKFKNDVLDIVKKKGFILPNSKPKKTFQSMTECNYPPPVTA